jgi:hypothetical protein
MPAAAINPNKPAPAAPAKGKKTPAPTQNLATIALQDIGFPYVFGGDHASGGWDCSSAVNWWVSKAGYKVPGGMRYDGTSHGPPSAAYIGWTGAKTIPNSQVQAGDILVWPGAGALGHIGVAISDTEMVSALNPTMGTAKSSISNTKAGVHLTRRVTGSPGIPADLTGFFGDISGGLAKAFDFLNPFKILSDAFGGISAIDLVQRAGLILLGVIVLILGLYRLAESEVLP